MPCLTIVNKKGAPLNATAPDPWVPRTRRTSLTARFGQKSPGFTLLELMVVLAIVAIMTTLAVPSFLRLIQSGTMASAANGFLADMRYARSQSIQRGRSVVMCRSNAPEAPSPHCDSDAGAGGAGWVSGWIIFLDTSHDADKQASELLLRVGSPITGIDTILEGAPDASTSFEFTATGRLLNPSSAASLRFGGDAYASAAQRVLCVSPGGHTDIAGNGAASCPSDNP